MHGLRHTMSSLMLRTGTDLKVVQSRLGHSTLAMTADTYTPIMPDLHQEAMERQNSVLS